jgi:hypothetical protein
MQCLIFQGVRGKVKIGMYEIPYSVTGTIVHTGTKGKPKDI